MKTGKKGFVFVPLWLYVLFFVLDALGSPNWLSFIGSLALLTMPWWSHNLHVYDYDEKEWTDNEDPR